MGRIWAYLVILMAWIPAIGQEVEMADQFRADGKIYVVIAVILILLIGLFVYLLKIEKNLREREKEQ
jgi:membrane protein DedA with SNARE-associated domain